MSRPSRRLRKGLMLLLCLLVTPDAVARVSPGPAAPQAGARRPLRMLALGDSVVWGQGLLDEHKFSYKLRDWLCAQRAAASSCPDGQDVQLHVEAHSGAVISKPDKRREREEEARFTRADSPVRFPGEVNNAFPTMWGQLELARRHYQSLSVPPGEVDLVIVNGGINDMNAARLLVSRLFGGDVKRLARKYSGDEMRRFLLAVADAFPNARIIVPGYFPLVSESTPPFILFETIKEWLFGAERVEARVFGAFQEDWFRRPGESEAAAAARTTLTMRRLAERSREFVEASNEALADAVKHLNERRPALAARPAGSGAPPPAATLRGHFVPIPFGPENAYAAPRSFLWKLGRKSPTLALKCADDNLITRFVVNDDVQATRPCMCDQAGRRNDPVCFRAGAFHPNREGSNAYFEAMRDKLAGVIAHTGWAAPD